MSSLEVSHIDLESGTGNHSRESDVGDAEEESSCDSEFHSAVRNFSGELDDRKPSPERECRICHMGLESNRHECGVPMVLGCSCKDDLGFVHKQCAETWFQIKGNKACEICCSIARNFSTAENENGEENDVEAERVAGESEDRRFWRGLNFIMTCMVSAFVILWFFHFNLPS